MKTFFQKYFLICFILISSIHAQNPAIAFGEDLISINNGHFELTLCPSIPGNDEYAYTRIVRGMDYKEIVVEKSSKKTGHTIWKKTLPFKQYELIKGTQLIKIDTVENTFIVFIKQLKPKTKEKILTAQVMDENMQFIGPEITVATSPSDDRNFGLFQIQRKGGFFIIHSSSPDLEGINDRNIPSRFTIINTQLNTIWTKDITLPKDRFFHLMASTLDSNNNLTAVYRSSFEKDNLAKEDPNSSKRVYRPVETKYEIYTYNYTNNTIASQTVSFSPYFKFFGDDKALIDSTNNTIKLYGQYNKQVAKKGFEGVYLTEFDLNSMAIIKTKILPFTPDIIAQFLGAKKALNGHLPEHYFIRNVFQSDDGEYSFLLEEFAGNTSSVYTAGSTTSSRNPGSNTTTYTTSAGRTSTNTTYAYGNLIICHSASDTEMSWCKKIARDSKDSSPNKLEHYSFIANNIVYVMFNATSKSVISYDTDQEYKFRNNAKDNVLVVIGFNQNGNTISNTAFAYEKDRNYTWHPQKTKQLSQNAISVYFAGPPAPRIDYSTMLKKATITLN